LYRKRLGPLVPLGVYLDAVESLRSQWHLLQGLRCPHTMADRKFHRIYQRTDDRWPSLPLHRVRRIKDRQPSGNPTESGNHIQEQETYPLSLSSQGYGDTAGSTD